MGRSVVLMGKGELAVRVAEWFRTSSEYDLRTVVPVMPEPTWTESLADWCVSRDAPVVSSGHYRDIPGVSEPGWTADLVLSVFYDKIIRPWFIGRPRRILNLHNSPLPRYRGMSPINWALKNGETRHGVTLHEITPGIDDGPIVSQLCFSIYPEFDEVIDVYRRSLEYGFGLFEQTMPLLDRITPQAQDESQATYYTARDADRLGERLDFTRARSRERMAAQAAANGAEECYAAQR